MKKIFLLMVLLCTYFVAITQPCVDDGNFINNDIFFCDDPNNWPNENEFVIRTYAEEGNILSTCPYKEYGALEIRVTSFQAKRVGNYELCVRLPVSHHAWSDDLGAPVSSIPYYAPDGITILAWDHCWALDVTSDVINGFNCNSVWLKYNDDISQSGANSQIFNSINYSFRHLSSPNFCLERYHNTSGLYYAHRAVPAGISYISQVPNNGSQLVHIPENSELIIDVPTSFTNKHVQLGEASKITVPNGEALIFDDEARIFGCGEKLYDGITVEDGGSLTFDHSRMKDAHKGINITGEVDLSLNYAVFQDCVYGIYARAQDPSDDLEIDVFTNNTFIGTQEILPHWQLPFTYARPEAGIDVAYYNIASLNATSDQTRNDFINLLYGVNSNSNNLIGQYNDFEECGTGYQIKGNKDSYVWYNNINNGYRGIHVERSGIWGEHNNITNVDYGINTFFNTTRLTLLEKNKIQARQRGFKSQWDFNGHFNNNDISITGNQATEIGIEHYFGQNLNHRDNVVNLLGNNAGVLMRNSENIDFTESTVNMNGSSSFNTAGIRIEGGEDNLVSCIAINGPSTDNFTGSTGMQITSSPMGNYRCNVINDTEVSMQFLANSDDSSVRGNEFGDNRIGLLLGPADFNQNAIIGTQDFNGNLWIGHSDFRAAINQSSPSSVTQQSRFRVDASVNSDFIPSSIDSDGTWFFDLSGSNKKCTGASSCSGDVGSGFNGPGADDVSAWFDNDLGNDPNVTDNEFWIWVYQLFGQASDSDGPGSDDDGPGSDGGDGKGDGVKPMFADFISEEQLTNIDKLTRVRKIIRSTSMKDNAAVSNLTDASQNVQGILQEYVSAKSKGMTSSDLEKEKSQMEKVNSQSISYNKTMQSDRSSSLREALEIVNSIRSSENVVLMHQAIYKELLQFEMNGFDTEILDIELLRSLSELCISEYGEVPVMSRGLLSMDESFVYNNEIQCVRGRDDDDEKVKATADILMKPNPTSGVVSILNDDFKSYKIMDVSGRIVGSGDFNGENSEWERLDVTHLMSGMYFVHIVNHENENIVTRLIKE